MDTDDGEGPAAEDGMINHEILQIQAENAFWLDK